LKHTKQHKLVSLFDLFSGEVAREFDEFRWVFRVLLVWEFELCLGALVSLDVGDLERMFDWFLRLVYWEPVCDFFK
jgi:hypothetical protein